MCSIILFGIFLCALVFDCALGITTGVTSTGDTFICLPNGTPCPTVGFGGQNMIHPRIVIPVSQKITKMEIKMKKKLANINELCPNGFFPCYGIETQCGEIFVEGNTSNDGNAVDGAHPWQAFIKNLTHAFAGSGALLDPFHVLTAAHKVESNQGTPEEVIVYMGVWDPTDLENTQSSPVKEILVHPSYNKESLLNDIAILRLEYPIIFGIQNNINTICVPEFESSFIGTKCMVSGWGQSSFTTLDAPTNPQKQVSVSVVDPQTCRESFARPSLLGGYVDMYLDQVGEICAGGEASRDACTQDGGSPLVCPDSTGKLNVAGLVIWGKNCGQPGVFGVYVNVPYYSNWIDTTLEGLRAKYNK
ncbi:unnamed protein product [Ceutorhynchus assimilis]|uniref:Peptidase S1 domain-containing protein n=1 Tax=Ceutorhynchus assimilis TaxID=467358 RepID=A0A9N9MV38_9CUCU|nr:unnamed protein product [Ceutorhynchus assimilis]